MSEPETKIWETHGVYSTWKEANSVRESLTTTHALVKVRRCGKDGRQYKIKFWNEPPPKKQNKKNKKKGK
jgi:hypothetical protein